MNRPPASASPLRTPAFLIVSAPRSGSTLLARMLNMHPRIRVPDETGFLLYAFGIDRRFQQRICAFNHDQVFQDSEIPRRTIRFSSQAEFFEAFVRHYRGTNDLLIGEKTPAHWYFLPNVREWLPETKIIFLVRDPVSVVSSCVANRISVFPLIRPPRFADLHVLAPALVWRAAADAWRAVRDDPASMLVRYEDLVADPRTTLIRISNHLGVDFDPAMLEYHRRTPPHGGSIPGSDGSRHHRNVSRPLRDDRIGARDALSDAETDLVRLALRNDQEEFGYADSASEEPVDFARKLATAERYFAACLAVYRVRERTKFLLTDLGIL